MRSHPLAASRSGLASGRRRAAVAVAAVVIAASCAGVARAAEDDPRDTVCRVVRGTIVPSCNGTICGQGSVTGDLAGRFTSKVTSIYPAGSGWIYTSWTRIELAGGKGRMETHDHGLTPFDSNHGPDLANSTEVLEISEASGAYQDYTGRLVVVGGHQAGQPTSYVGQVCHPMSVRDPSHDLRGQVPLSTTFVHRLVAVGSE